MAISSSFWSSFLCKCVNVNFLANNDNFHNKQFFFSFNLICTVKINKKKRNWNMKWKEKKNSVTLIIIIIMQSFFFFSSFVSVYWMKILLSLFFFFVFKYWSKNFNLLISNIWCDLMMFVYINASTFLNFSIFDLNFQFFFWLFHFGSLKLMYVWFNMIDWYDFFFFSRAIVARFFLLL